MHILADFALTRGARHIGQIGPRTLRAFQKAMNYTDSTMQCYRQALQSLKSNNTTSEMHLSKPTNQLISK